MQRQEYHLSPRARASTRHRVGGRIIDSTTGLTRGIDLAGDRVTFGGRASIFGGRHKEIWREDNGEGSRLKIPHYVHWNWSAPPARSIQSSSMNRNEGSPIIIVIFCYFMTSVVRVVPELFQRLGSVPEVDASGRWLTTFIPCRATKNYSISYQHLFNNINIVRSH